MKKLLTVSLVAMMAVSAARADIASTDFVTGKTGDIVGLTTTNKTNLTAAVNELVTSVSGVKATADAAATASDLSALQGTVSTLSGTVTTNKEAADKTQADLDTLEETVAGLKGTGDQAAVTKAEFNTLSQTVTTNESDIEGKMTALTERVDTAEGEIETLTGAADVDGSVANAKKAGTDAAAALETYKTTVEDTYATQFALTQGLGTKQNTIADLETIRSGAAAGAKAVQPAAIADMQVKSNIETDPEHDLSPEEANQKYTSVSYVDAKVGGINTGLGDVNNTLLEHKDLIDDNAAAIENLDDIYVTDSAFTTFQTGNTTAITAAKKAGDDAQADLNAYKTSNDAALADVKATADANKASIEEMDLGTISAAGKAIVSVTQADGKVTAAVGEITNAGIAADAGIEQSKIAGLETDLAAKLDKSALTNASKAGTGETGTADGVYTLTMKVAGGVQTYVWEKIAR